jgi:hypothetical protein
MVINVVQGCTLTDLKAGGKKAIRKGNSHEFPNSIFVNLKSNTIMKKLQCKDKCNESFYQIYSCKRC